MNLGGLLGIDSAINQIFTDIWQALVGLLTGVINLVLNIGAVPISTTDPASPIAGLWPAMLAVGGAIAVILFFAQLAMAAFHPRRHLTHAVTGPVAYGVAIAVTVTVVAVTLSAADGLTTLVLQQAAHVDDVGGAVSKIGLATTAVNGVKPVALALMAIVAILPLSIGFAVEMLFRAMAILVLVATIPLVAAGLTNSATRHWYWRAARWILAAIFIKPTLAITIAIGVLVVGNTHPAGNNGAQTLVTLLLGLGILFVSLFAPFALYRLFAFVEPGTMPHEAMRSAFNDARASFSQAAGAMSNPAANAGGLMSDAASRRWGGGNAADPAGSTASSPPWPAAGLSAGSGSSTGAGSSSGSSNGSKVAALAGVAAVAAAGTGAAAGGGAAAGTGSGAAAVAGGGSAGTGAGTSGAAASGNGAGALGSTGGPQDAVGGARAGSSSGGGAGWSGQPGAADDPLWSSLPSPSTGSSGGGSGRSSVGGGGGRGHYGVGAISGGPSGLPGAVPSSGGGYDAPPPRPARGDSGGAGPARAPLPGRSPAPRHLDDVVDPPDDPPEDLDGDDSGSGGGGGGGGGSDDGAGWRRGEGHGLSGVL